MLSIEGLNVRYPSRPDPAVAGVSMHIRTGEFVILAGDSASGKSTLMQAVCGFIPHIIPAEISGKIMIDGINSGEPSELARIVSMVQQDPESQFCTETVEDEVAFGPENFCHPRSAIEAVVQKSLADVNASHLRHRELGNLSGGEKQKIAIASMLALNPKLLILDEPTSNLDPVSISEILTALANLRLKNRNLTIIIVEHRIRSYIELIDRLMIMKKGAIVADCSRRADPIHFSELMQAVGAPVKFGTRPKVPQSTGTILSVRGLDFNIGGKRILSGISFDVRRGSVVALMGRNGSGKTTLLRHIAALEHIQHGTIHILGNTISNRTNAEPDQLGRHFGFVFQNPNHQLFENTVENEVLFGPRNFGTDMNSALACSREFASAEQLDSTAHPQSLSFGQKRRLNIRTAVVHEPGLILLDEPFSGQDPDNTNRIAELITAHQRNGKTFIIVTHDAEFASSFCTDLLVLEQGRLIASGIIEKAMNDPQVRGVLGT